MKFHHTDKRSLRAQWSASYAYMEHADRGSGAVIDGLLVYPKVEDPLSARFSVKAHGVRAEAIDLKAPWPTIRQELLSYLQPAIAS